MPNYSYYLHGRDGEVLAGDSIETANLEEAITLISVICSACSDVCTGFDIWSDQKPVVFCSAQVPAHEEGTMRLALSARVPTLKELSDRRQQIVLDREIALRDSNFCISESRRLLRRIQDLFVNIGARE